jgi:hypothetical protein
MTYIREFIENCCETRWEHKKKRKSHFISRPGPSYKLLTLRHFHKSLLPPFSSSSSFYVIFKARRNKLFQWNLIRLVVNFHLSLSLSLSIQLVMGIERGGGGKEEKYKDLIKFQLRM